MIELHRHPPSQKALPIADWTRADRETWEAAQAKAGVLDDGGMASHLSPRTLEDLTSRYAYFLSFLVASGRLNPDGPAASVTEDNILLYVRFLEPRVSSVTLAQSIYKIARVAACLAPERDWRWLKRVARRLDLRAKPRDKRNEVVEIRELFRLGLQLMDRAEQAESLTVFPRALLYRNGLIIALLAADPLRLDNITTLEIGRTLIKDGATWSFDIPAEQTKERRLHLAILPDWSSRYIDRYIEAYRPCFRNAGSTMRLWLGKGGRPLGTDGLYYLVCKQTRLAFNKRINPHLFRACLVTSTAVHYGAHMGLAMTVLRHQNSKVTLRHYDQAEMIDAVRAYQDMLLDDVQPGRKSL
jgi:integrase/recombinase XerD